MRQAKVLRNGAYVGMLRELDDASYEFEYDEQWLSDETKAGVSLSLPKQKEIFKSSFLFPFFFNLLSEGVNRKLQSLQLKIDENDHFGFLLATARYDTIGAISIEAVDYE